MKWKHFFSFLAAQQGNGSREVLERKLDLEQLQVKTPLMLSVGLNIGECIQKVDTQYIYMDDNNAILARLRRYSD